MTLIDELKKMRNKGRFVVSIDYVLESLRSTEINDKAKVEHSSIQDKRIV